MIFCLLLGTTTTMTTTKVCPPPFRDIDSRVTMAPQKRAQFGALTTVKVLQIGCPELGRSVTCARWPDGPEGKVDLSLASFRVFLHEK